MLSAVICRIRDDAGAVPLAVTYDYHERIYGPPMPILFQHRVGLENRQISAPAIRKLLDLALAAARLTGTAGQPLRLIPHDFRRIFITDAFHERHAAAHRPARRRARRHQHHHGLQGRLPRRSHQRPPRLHRPPPRVAPQQGIPAADRRGMGGVPRPPAARSRSATAAGPTAPAASTNTRVRCPLLRPDPAQRPRLAGLCDNLQARIGEAEHEGWLGEAEGLKVSLAAAQHKLTQLDELARRRSAIHLGMPGFPDIASRTVTTPGQQHS